MWTPGTARVCALRIGLGVLCDWSLGLGAANYLRNKLKSVFEFLRTGNHYTTVSQASSLRTLHVDLYIHFAWFPTGSSFTFPFLHATPSYTVVKLMPHYNRNNRRPQ